MDDRPDTDPARPALAHGGACACALHARRRAGVALLALGSLGPAWAWAQDGVRGDVGRESRFTKLVSADQVEQAATQQYGQLKREALAKSQLVPGSDPQVMRLRAIAERLIPFAKTWNRRAANWPWEINLIRQKDLNAFCMPGGKIAFYSGLLVKLQLTDDEVAMIMGHEMAHALREHARERMGKTAATRIGAGLFSSLLGLGNLGDTALNMGATLLTLKFSREDESEADLIGLDMAARAGFDPRAGVTLWQKMTKAAEGAPPEFISTHPASSTRIQEIEAALPKVEPLYAAAPRPTQRWAPPKAN